MYKVVLGILLALTLLGVLAARMSASSQENGSLQQSQNKTQKLKEHSKFFKHHGPKLRDITPRGRGVIEVVSDAPDTVTIPDAPGPRRLSVAQAVCSADAVVLGTLNSELPQLTDDENFIFTEFEMGVEAVIKNNPAAEIRPGEVISVVRDGGTLVLNGKTFRATVEGFRPLSVGGRYVLLLRFVPATGSYLAFANGSFGVGGRVVEPFGQMPDKAPRDTADFLNAISAAADCAQGQTR